MKELWWFSTKLGWFEFDCVVSKRTSEILYDIFSWVFDKRYIWGLGDRSRDHVTRSMQIKEKS